VERKEHDRFSVSLPTTKLMPKNQSINQSISLEPNNELNVAQTQIRANPADNSEKQRISTHACILE